MPLPKLTKDFWNGKSEIIEAAVKGWNPQQRLPRLLKEAYPDLKHLQFGFCHKDDAAEWMSQGWMPLPTTQFDVEEFNRSDIPSRFGLRDVDGTIWWRENMLMVMDVDFRDRLVGARNAHHEKAYQDSIRDKKYTAPSDPRADEMAKYAESTLESKTVQPTDAKRGPGRPRKQ